MPNIIRKRPILVPIGISTARSGRAEKRGTKAFVYQDSSLLEDSGKAYRGYRDVKRNLKQLKRIEARESKRRGYFYSHPDSMRVALASDEVAMRLTQARKKIAEWSDYYAKPTSRRVKEIRSILLKNGVNVEQPMPVRNIDKEDRVKGRIPSDLGGNYELFEQRKYREIPQNPKNFESIKSQILRTLAKMHSLGISHNHLHLGNWVVNPEGRVQLIDLSLARINKKPITTKQEFLSRFASDLFLSANAIAYIKLPYVYNTVYSNVPHEFRGQFDKERNSFFVDALSMHGEVVSKLGITPKDVEDHYSEMRRKQREKARKKRGK